MQLPDEVLARYAGCTIPVLARSIDALKRLGADQDAANPRELADVVLHDPMLTLIVVRHLQTHRSRRNLEDITTVEHAIMMLGIRQFFSAFRDLPAIEDVLKDDPPALAGLGRVIIRARSAATYARAFAGLRADLSGDQVVAAALLHDLAEMLLWCVQPAQALAIAARQAAEPGLRSADAQRAALGFSLLELQLALARHWGLPELLLSLMDDTQAQRPRVQNVALSVALSRHASRDWSNPALPDDLQAIGRLLSLTPKAVRGQVFDATLTALLDRGLHGMDAEASPLPPLPEAEPAEAFDEARIWLRNIANGVPMRAGSGWNARRGLLPDARREALAALAAAMHALCAGLGYRGVSYLTREPLGAVRERFFSGAAGAASAQASFGMPVHFHGQAAALLVAHGVAGPDKNLPRFKELTELLGAALTALSILPGAPLIRRHD